MEQGKLLLDEFVGKKLLVRTHLGTGSKFGMLEGEYKGIILEHDGKFVKLEYEIKKFADGGNTITKLVVLINIDYIITLEEFPE